MSTRIHSLLAAAAVATCNLPALAEEPTVLERATHWTAYKHDGPPAKLCFALSQPREQEPRGMKRDQVFLYVTAWPGDGIKTEISLKWGSALKPGSEVVATVGGSAFKLFTADDRAFVADPAEEERLLETMKKSVRMVVKGTTDKGVPTTDVFILNGVSQALLSIAQTCP